MKPSSRGEKEVGNAALRLADHAFASLRNIAAHSSDRRQQILALGGEQVGVEALALFRGRDSGPSRSVAAFLRNLSEGSDGVVPLASAGFLQLAEEELDDNLGGPQVRRHILAALQNMAAQVGQSGEVFSQPASWLELCAIASQRALQDRDSRTTQQALGAMGNFAVLRAAKEALPMDAAGDGGDYGPTATMRLAAGTTDLLDQSDEEAELPSPEATKPPSDSEELESEQSSLASGFPRQDAAGKSLPRSGSGSDLPSVPTDDQELDLSLGKAHEKVPPAMIQNMLDLLQVRRRSSAHAGVVEGAVSAPSVSIATSTAATLANFAQDTDIERLIGSMGGIEIVLESVGTVDAEEFHLQAVRFLWNMTFSKINQQRFMDNEGVEKVLAILGRHCQPQHAQLQEQGCGVLRNLAYGHTGRHKLKLLQSGVIQCLCEALERFYRDVQVCLQAVAGLTAMCDRAPPAALQASQNGAITWLVRALKLTGDKIDITQQILQALASILIIPEALTPFGLRGGHLEVLKVVDRLPSDGTLLLAFRTLAAALSHTKLKDLKDQNLAAIMAQELEEQEDDDNPMSAAEKENLISQWQLMSDAPGSQIRIDLMDAQIIRKVVNALRKFHEYSTAIEAAAGVLLNLALEVHEKLEKDEYHLNRKLEVGLECHKCLTIIGHLAAERSESNAGFAANMFYLLAAVSLNEEVSLLLYREQAAARSLQYMKAYKNQPRVQAAGAAFLSNLAKTKLRIREAVVEVGCIEYLLSLLSACKDDATVVSATARVLKDLLPAQAAYEIVRKHDIINLIFEAVDQHVDNADAMGASMNLLWTLSALSGYAEQLNRTDTTVRALQALRLHRMHHEVCRCCGGLLRNLLSAPLNQQAAATCVDGGGLRLLLTTLWHHCLPDEAAAIGRATVAANRASLQSLDGLDAEYDPGAEAELAERKRRLSQLRRRSQTGHGGDGPAKRASVASVGSAGHGNRRGSRRSSIGSETDLRNTHFETGDEDNSDSMAVAEQILAALRNLSAFSHVAAELAEEVFVNEEWDQLRTVVEVYSRSVMVQFQGFDLIGRLVNAKRDLRRVFRRISDHVLLMSQHHKTTPVADAADLLLEALN